MNSPYLTGLIGTLIPAERASRLTPMNGIRGVQKTSVKKEKIIRRGIVGAMAVFIYAFGTLMVQAIMKFADTENSEVAVDYPPTEGGTVTPVSSGSTTTGNNSNEVQNNKEDNNGFEISSKITHDQSPYKDLFYFEAKKVSDSPLAIDFTFSTRDSAKYYMKPYQHFYIKQSDVIYRPISTELVEVVGLDENHI